MCFIRFLFDIFNGKYEKDYDADKMITGCLQKLIKKIRILPNNN
jgi:hypothetical protein